MDEQIPQGRLEQDMHEMLNTLKAVAEAELFDAMHAKKATATQSTREFINGLLNPGYTPPVFFDWRERPGGRPCQHGRWRTVPCMTKPGIHVRECVECVECGVQQRGTRKCGAEGHQWNELHICTRCGFVHGKENGFPDNPTCQPFSRGGMDSHVADAFEYVVPPSLRRGPWAGHDAKNFESDEAFRMRAEKNCPHINRNFRYTKPNPDTCCHEFDELTKFCTLCGMALADFVRTDPYANGSRNLADDVAAWERENGILKAPNCPTCSTKMAAKAVGPAHILRGTWECPRCWAEVVDTEATPVEPEPMKQLPAHGDGVH